MAASGNVPEQGRPPEALRKYGVDRKSPVKGVEGGATYRNNNDVNDNEMTDVNYNVERRRLLKEEAKIGSCKETLRKVFFKKIKSEEEIKTVSGSLETGRKARNSFLHQDVEEALNSLLWQPYEYQKTSMSSLSSCGSLESSSNNTESSGNVADLHLLVNNLRVNRLSQSRAAHRSRDPAERRSETYLPIAASRLEQLKGAASCYASLSRYNVHCDEYPYKAGDMRVEIQPVLTRSENTVCVSTPSQNRNVVHPGTTRNLSSVNVVGLPPPNVVPTRVPHHSRNTSEPYTSLPVNHPRNGSEPLVTTYNRVVQIQQRYPVSHLRSSSVPYQQQPQQQNVNVAQNARSKVPLNVSNVNVNYYRAVPVNVVSAVPTIQCTNTDSNNVSNVNIMPVGANTTTTTSTEVVVHSTPAPEIRTFTSTEAQTDDPQDCNREQRRRERRERRHQRRLNNHRHNAAAAAENTASTQTERLPDLVPPPYSTMPSVPPVPVPAAPPPPPVVPMVPPPGTIVQSMVPNNIVPSGLIANGMVPFHPTVVPGQVPLVQGAGAVPVPVPSPTGFRFPFPAGGFRRSRYSEEPPKSCCGLLAWRPGSLRWFIALIALVAVCCVLVGTALGAMRPSGRDHLTVSLLMIGVGIILVTVSGVAWRLTSHDSSTCRSMLGLGSTESVEVCPRRFVPRLPPSYGRPHHPYAAMMYPEFQYRPPPPSYQASMQEYRLRLLLLDRGNTPQIQSGIQNAVSPPPTYRSHSGSLLRAPLSNRRDLSQSEYSCPPSYRSQTSSRPATLLPSNAIIHSREHSLSISESNNESVVNVVNILSTNEEEIALDNITLDSLKLEPDNDINPLRMLLKGSSSDLEGSKDGNLVTIVQTSDQSPVIVTVSGSSHDNCNTVQITEIPSEMEILAHL